MWAGQVVRLLASVVRRLQGAEGSFAATERTLPQEPRSCARAACPDNRDAQDEARRAITAWLDGRDPKALPPSDRPTLKATLVDYVKRPDAPTNDALQVEPLVQVRRHSSRPGQNSLLETGSTELLASW
jgi:hypothetical protein